MSSNISLIHSRSLRVIQNDTLDEKGVYKSLLVVHCNYMYNTVSELFSEWRDLEICVCGR